MIKNYQSIYTFVAKILRREAEIVLTYDLMHNDQFSFIESG